MGRKGGAAARVAAAHRVSGIPGKIAPEAASQLSRTLDVWRDKYPEVPIRREVVSKHPAWVLSSYCARADLVVLGRHDSPGAPARVIGSVLRNARGPVAVVPANN